MLIRPCSNAQGNKLHNVDPQVLDAICLKMDWILPIHDAGIVTWKGATQMRELALEEMKFINKHGRMIIESYMRSINVDTEGWKRYYKLLYRIEEENEGKQMNISRWLLK